MNAQVARLFLSLVLCGFTVLAYAKKHAQGDKCDDTSSSASEGRSLSGIPQVWINTDLQLLSVSVVAPAQKTYFVTVRGECDAVVGSAVLVGDGTTVQLPLALWLPGVYTIEVANNERSYRRVFNYNPS